MPMTEARTENHLTSNAVAGLRGSIPARFSSIPWQQRCFRSQGSQKTSSNLHSDRLNEVHVRTHRPSSPCPWLLPALLGIAWIPMTAEAACSAWPNNATNLSQTLVIESGTAITLAQVPIGSVMAKTTLRVSGGMGNFSCGRSSIYRMAIAGMSLPPASQSNVYQTSVEGVGVRIGFHTSYMGGWPTTRYPPFESSEFAQTSLLSLPYYADVEFIRTGMAVGRGSVTFNYRADIHIPTAVETVVPITGTNLRFNLSHNSYYNACVSTLPVQEVRMGQVVTTQVQAGSAATRGFSFTVDCDGMNVASAPTVKVYFEGDAARDGLLNLQDAGKPGVTTGVGIELLSDRHVALPFARERAISMDWQGKLPNGHRYGFSGTARYVPSGGTVTPGQADAHLVYVLEYN